MKIVGMKNCIVQGCSATCLAIVLFGLLLILVGNVIFNKFFNPETKIILNDFNKSRTDPNLILNTHLRPKDKPVLFRIALVSDTENSWDSFDSALKLIAGQNVIYLAHMGDVTSFGVLSDLEKAKKLVSRYGVEFLPIPGDRDIYKSGQKLGDKTNFRKAYGQTYYSKEINGIKMLFIDNSSEYGGIEPEQWDFIKANIGESHFVFLHNPVYFSNYLFGAKGMGQYSKEVDEQRKLLLELIRKSNVVAVFTGDQHLFNETTDSEDPDLNHYVVGSLSENRNLESPNFTILNVYDDGDYSVEKITL